jgi:predicted nucleic acid binding AN1-type Zn finger protein
MQSLKCFHWTKDTKCKKITLVEQITNKCTSCTHVFCNDHWSKHTTMCTALNKKREQDLSTLQVRLVLCTGKKVDEI